MISREPTCEPVWRVMLIDHDRRFVEDARLLFDMQPNMELVAWLPDCQSVLRYAEDFRPDALVFGWSWDVAQRVRELRQLGDTDYRPTIIILADDGNLSAFVAAKRCGAHSVHYRCNADRVLVAAIRRCAATRRAPSRPEPPMALRQVCVAS